MKCDVFRFTEILDDMRELTNSGEMTHCAAAEVVVSGLSGRLPESDNIAEFREHLINGDDMVTDDDRRWEPGECHNDPDDEPVFTMFTRF